MKKTKLLITITAVILLIISQTACASEEAPVSKTGYYLDTICQIDIYGMDEDEAAELIDGAFAVCSDCEQLLSKTVRDSDVDRINRDGKAKVDDMTVELIEKGLYYGDLSHGRFDISVGCLTDMWDFHSDEHVIPDKGDIEEAVKHIDYNNIVIDSNTVSMKDDAADIDLGGIAKGYICDRVAEYLTENGVTSAIVNLGGNITAIGSKNGEKPFKIGIERPFSDRSEIIGYVEAEDKTFVTSGIYERYFEKDGKVYHHILDVETGYPVDNDLDSVTIISDKGRSADCDALSTICLMLGVDEGKKLIDSLDGYEAVFVDSEGNITTTDGAGFIEE